MRKRFTPKIPKKPLFRRNTYMIPKSYSKVYKKAGITNSDKQKVLFHVTQFGGFRCKRFLSYMKYMKDFMSEWLKAKKDEGFHSFRANPKFLAEFGDIELQPLQRTWKNEVLNEEEMREYGFSEGDIRDSYNFLFDLNEFYSSLRLGIKMPSSGITIEDKINFSRFHSIPFLVKKPKAGGRFFHPESSYQRIKSSLRRTLTINKEKTSEVDLSAATLQFLGIVMKNYSDNQVIDEVISKKDPYDYFLETLNSNEFIFQDRAIIDREEIKPVLYATIYSPEKIQASSLKRKLRPLGLDYYNFVFLFQEFFNALHDFKSNTEFPPHVVIFKEESRYAQEVLREGCLQSRIPILPLHDSFITTKDNLENLVDIMDKTSERLYGRCLEHHTKIL